MSILQVKVIAKILLLKQRLTRKGMSCWTGHQQKGEMHCFGELCIPYLKSYSRSETCAYICGQFHQSLKLFSNDLFIFCVLILLPKSFRWIEFAKKSVAKRVANLLNGEQIGVFSLTFYSFVLLLSIGSCILVYMVSLFEEVLDV